MTSGLQDVFILSWAFLCIIVESRICRLWPQKWIILRPGQKIIFRPVRFPLQNPWIFRTVPSTSSAELSGYLHMRDPWVVFALMPGGLVPSKNGDRINRLGHSHISVYTGRPLSSITRALDSLYAASSHTINLSLTHKYRDQDTLFVFK